MNLKYYLRGLGIGIFVTALIMGVAIKSHPQTMSESEIRAEAAKLGMVDGRTVLQDAKEQEEEIKVEIVEENDEDSKTVSVNAVVSDDETAVDETENLDETQKEESQGSDDTEDTQTDDTDEIKNSETKNDESKKTVTIVINSGDGSHIVSKRLEEAGIVEDAWEYDKYLCENGYERRLRVGSYEIPVDASDEEIARIITRR